MERRMVLHTPQACASEEENSLGYRKGKLERCMTSEDIDPMTGQRWQNNFEPPVRKYMKAKKDISATWPINYDDDRIIEEMGLVFSNKVQIHSKLLNTFRAEGMASDGIIITVFKDKYGKWSIFPENRYIN